MESNPRPVRPEDKAHDEWVVKQNQLTLRAMILTLAVCIAPFLVLPFGFTPALFVLGVGLSFTGWLCFSGANQVGVASRTKLRAAGMMNFALAFVVFAIVVIRFLA